MKRRTLFPSVLGLLCALTLAASSAARAEEEEPAFLRHLFAPELVMQHQSAIGLSTSQREKITQQIREVQGDVLEKQWAMSDAVEALERAVSGEVPEREAALDAARRIFSLEQEVKLRHLELLLWIKATLTSDQRSALLVLRDGSAP